LIFSPGRLFSVLVTVQHFVTPKAEPVGDVTAAKGMTETAPTFRKPPADAGRIRGSLQV